MGTKSFVAFNMKNAYYFEVARPIRRLRQKQPHISHNFSFIVRLKVLARFHAGSACMTTTSTRTLEREENYIATSTMKLICLESTDESFALLGWLKLKLKNGCLIREKLWSRANKDKLDNCVTMWRKVVNLLLTLSFRIIKFSSENHLMNQNQLSINCFSSKTT